MHNCTSASVVPVVPPTARVDRLKRFEQIPMSVQPTGSNEILRLASLASFDIMDTGPERAYDDIARLAAEICGAPAACVNFLGEDDTFFKSAVGFGELRGTSRATSLCDRTIRTADPVVIEDASKDPLCEGNPSVANGLRFYLGAPLIDPRTGQGVGALCVVDYKPRQAAPFQRQMLQLLAGQAVAALESRRRIRELNQVREELERAQKQKDAALKAKDDLLLNISHEIRTPLNAMTSIIHLLGSTPLSLEQHQYVVTLENSGKLLHTIVNDILDYRKMESGDFQLQVATQNVVDVVEGVARLAEPHAASKGLGLVWFVSPSVPSYLRFDATRFQQVLLNFLSNSVKFSNDGCIELYLGGQWLSPATPTTPKSRQFSLEIEVRDVGIGISPEQLAKLFVPFSQVHPSGANAGAGLGLVICQRLVHAMGGEKIQVQSALGVGTTVRFHITCDGSMTPFLSDSVPASPMPLPTPMTEACVATAAVSLVPVPAAVAVAAAAAIAIGPGSPMVVDTTHALLRDIYGVSVPEREQLTCLRVIDFTSRGSTSGASAASASSPPSFEPEAGWLRLFRSYGAEVITSCASIAAAAPYILPSAQMSDVPSLVRQVAVVVDTEASLALLGEDTTLEEELQALYIQPNALPCFTLFVTPTSRRKVIHTAPAPTACFSTPATPMLLAHPPHVPSASAAPTPKAYARSTPSLTRQLSVTMTAASASPPDPASTLTTPLAVAPLASLSAYQHLHNASYLSIPKPFEAKLILRSVIGLLNAPSSSHSQPPSHPQSPVSIPSLVTGIALGGTVMSSAPLLPLPTGISSVVTSTTVMQPPVVSEDIALSLKRPLNGSGGQRPISKIAHKYPLRILLAEDNVINQKVLTMLLRKLGYEIAIAEHGVAVLEHLARESARGRAHEIECILMDASMDVMDGIECTRVIRTQQLPHHTRPFIIAQTANVTDDYKNVCLAAGMDAFMTKPIQMDHLVQCLKDAYRAHHPEAAAAAATHPSAVASASAPTRTLRILTSSAAAASTTATAVGAPRSPHTLTSTTSPIDTATRTYKLAVRRPSATSKVA